MAKIGGEFRAPGKHDRTRWQARVSFLRCIEGLAPQVLNDLRTTVQPAFREAVDATTTAESASEGSPADDQQLARHMFLFINKAWATVTRIRITTFWRRITA